MQHALRILTVLRRKEIDVFHLGAFRGILRLRLPQFWGVTTDHTGTSHSDFIRNIAGNEPPYALMSRIV